MKPILYFSLFLLSMVSLVVGSDLKKKFDIVDPIARYTFSKTSGVPFLGWKVKQSISEITILPGFYMTWGTVNGISPSSLDNNTSVLFGHPYAKTSYPMISLDAVWNKAETLFPHDSTTVNYSGDSLITITNRGHQKYSFETTYQLLNEGKSMLCVMRLINRDIVSHIFSLGHVIDPALGNRGDAVILAGGKQIIKDTIITNTTVDMLERSNTTYGMKATLSFNGVNPMQTLIKNWTAIDIDTPSYNQDKVSKLYDVVLKSFWNPASVQPGDTLVRSFSLSLDTPNFGSSIFTRWDIPRFLQMEDGILHPADFKSTVSIANNSAQGKTVSVELKNSNYISSSNPQESIVSSQDIGYTHFPISIKEIYEDVVADLTLIASVGSVPVDTLVIPLYIPATPISDTGLTVTIDSLITSAKPTISTIFEVTRNATGQKIFFIKPENIFLYENQTRIHNFALQKDTSGGADALDLVFVLDVTGSMGGTIDGVKNNIIEFADSLNMRGIDFRIGMVTFLDEIENVYDFVTEAQAFKDIVAQQYAHGGGDGPENSIDALIRASQFQFRNEAKRVAIWITDISYHENDWVTTKVKSDAVNALLQNDITVHAIGPQEYQTDWYNPIIEPTGGNYYNIYGNFRDILLDISRMKTTSRFLLSYTSPNSGSGDRAVKIEIHFAGLGGSDEVTYQNPLLNFVNEPLSCFPNPFNPQITIQLQMPEDGLAKVTIYNILGQQTRQFDVSGINGTASITWDATDKRGSTVASGIYFVKAEIVTHEGIRMSSETAKIVYIK